MPRRVKIQKLKRKMNSKITTIPSPRNEDEVCFIHKNFTERDNRFYFYNRNCLSDSPFYEYDGQKYCLFHFPKNSHKELIKLFKNKFQNHFDWITIYNHNMRESSSHELEPWQLLPYDFSYIYFPDADFFFSKRFEANVICKGATFKSFAKFSHSEFISEVDFRSTIFEQMAFFDSVKFYNNVLFDAAEFHSFADFSYLTLEKDKKISFKDTKIIKELDLSNSTINGSIIFEGGKGNNFFVEEDSVLNLQNTQFEDAKKIYFHSIRIEPNWFLHTDCKNFNFTDCKGMYGNEKELNVRIELKKLQSLNYKNPNAFLSKTCWQLADNHEEMKDFAESSKYRKIANESKRLELPKYKQPFTLHWWYYAVSFYGENWWQSFFVLLGILLVSGFFYEWFGVFQMDNPQSMTGGEGFIHSLYVAALQRPEPKAADNLTKLVVILETIFAPLQAALLALAIRRKFMR